MKKKIKLTTKKDIKEALEDLITTSDKTSKKVSKTFKKIDGILSGGESFQIIVVEKNGFAQYFPITIGDPILGEYEEECYDD